METQDLEDDTGAELDADELADLESDSNDTENSRFFNKCRDNGVEWYTGQERVTATFSQRKWISKIKKYAEKRPDDVTIVVENLDGSIMAHLPLSWVKISPPKQVSEEQKERMRLQAQKNIAEGKFGRRKKVNTEEID